MPKHYKRHGYKPKSYRKFGKYNPNRFQASYGGNLQNRPTKKCQVIEVTGVPFTVNLDLTAGDFSGISPIQWSLDQLGSLNGIVDFWQQFRFLDAELTMRPKVASGSDSIVLKDIAVAPHWIAGLNLGQVSQINLQFIKDLPGAQVKKPDLQTAGFTNLSSPIQTNAFVINSFCKKPVVAVNGLNSQTGANSISALAINSPRISTLTGTSVVHNGFLIGFSGTAQAAATGVDVLEGELKFKIECCIPKPGAYVPRSLNDSIMARVKIEPTTRITPTVSKLFEYVEGLAEAEKEKFLDEVHKMC